MEKIKASASSPSIKSIKIISLNKPVAANVHPDLPKRNTPVAIHALLEAAGIPKMKSVLPYLTFSAAKTFDAAKGYLNAIACSNVSPGVPVIDFPWVQKGFGGKLEAWLTDVKAGDSFALQFRVYVGFPPGQTGQWRIGSSDTQAHFIDMVPVYQSLDFYIPPVRSGTTMSLITLDASFGTSGSWGLKDVIIHKLN